MGAQAGPSSQVVVTVSRSVLPSPGPFPLGADAPPTGEVPHFAPVRVRGGRLRPHRLVRHRRRAVAAGLAVTAAALVAAGPRQGDGRADTGPADFGGARGHPAVEPVRERAGPRLVAAPVRIADAESVRLLGPGDRVDVVATGGSGRASVVARGVRVTEVPDPGEGAADGALVVVSVPRGTAHRLVGAGTTGRLAVTLW